jgi:hypothetical protein
MNKLILVVLACLLIIGCQKSTSPISGGDNQSVSAMLTTEMLKEKAAELAKERFRLDNYILTTKVIPPDSSLQVCYYEPTSSKLVATLTISKKGEVRELNNDKISLRPIEDDRGGSGGGSGSGGSSDQITLAQFFEDSGYRMNFGGTPLTISLAASSLQSSMEITISFSNLDNIYVAGRSIMARWNDRMSSFKAYPGTYNGHRVTFNFVKMWIDSDFRNGLHKYAYSADDNFVDEHFCDDLSHPDGCYRLVNDAVSSLSFDMSVY